MTQIDQLLKSAQQAENEACRLLRYAQAYFGTSAQDMLRTDQAARTYPSGSVGLRYKAYFEAKEQAELAWKEYYAALALSQPEKGEFAREMVTSHDRASWRAHLEAEKH